MKVSIYYLIITIIISILLVIFIHNDIKRTQSVLLEGMTTSEAITELIPVTFDEGNITLPNNLTVNKDTTLQGKLQVNKDTTIQGTLQVNKDTTIQGKLQVNNDTTLLNNLTVNRDTTVKKDLYVNGSVLCPGMPIYKKYYFNAGRKGLREYTQRTIFTRNNIISKNIPLNSTFIIQFQYSLEYGGYGGDWNEINLYINGNFITQARENSGHSGGGGRGYGGILSYYTTIPSNTKKTFNADIKLRNGGDDYVSIMDNNCFMVEQIAD